MRQARRLFQPRKPCGRRVRDKDRAVVAAGSSTSCHSPKIVNHCGIHSDISSSFAACKTHDARHVAKPLLISKSMPQGRAQHGGAGGFGAHACGAGGAAAAAGAAGGAAGRAAGEAGAGAAAARAAALGARTPSAPNRRFGMDAVWGRKDSTITEHFRDARVHTHSSCSDSD